MVSGYGSFEPLAIVGMDATWAGCDGLDDFECMVYEARQQFAQAEERRHGFNPACLTLLTKSARRATLDGGFDLDRPGPARIAALVASSQAVPVRWDWACQVADLSGQANPLAAALEQAQEILARGQADAVLFAACAGSIHVPENVPLAEGVAGMGFDKEVHGWRIGEGGGAVVWMRYRQAVNEGRRIYAVVRSLASAPGRGAGEESTGIPVPPALEDVRGCCQAALAQAGVLPGQVGYVETFASGSDALDAIEIAGLVQAYRQAGQDLTTAVGSAQANTGYLDAAAGLSALVRAALCLYYRTIPGVPAWTAPKLPALWRNAPFYVPAESRAWFEKAGGPGRLAGVNAIGRNGSFAHLLLGEAAEQRHAPDALLSQVEFFLFPLAGGSLDDLLEQLNDLQRALTFATNLPGLAGEYYEAARAEEDAPYAVCIVGHNHDEVQHEIELARKAIPAAFEKGAEWQTPLGSYFAGRPAGQLGGVALVYPGAFNSYPGVGKDLFRLFPGLHADTAALTEDMGRTLRERMLYPRSLAALSKEEMAALEAALLADPIAMLVSGAALAVLYTYILQEIFAVRPAAAFGYSLGENSMMFALGVWSQGDQAARRLEESEAFRIRLAGPQQAIREYWGMGPEAVGTDPLWSNYLVMAAPEKVQAALEKEQHVYLTHINTPRQVVIGGDPAACQRVLSGLRASSIKAPFDYALHCDVMRSEFEELVRLHNWPVEKCPAPRMYTAADYGPLQIDQEEIARKIAHMLTTPLDFPRLIRKVYEDGARVFIEAGAGSNCARWIDETLKDSPHLSISMNRRGTDDATTLVRTLARLYSHRVPMNLEALYRPDPQRVNL